MMKKSFKKYFHCFTNLRELKYAFLNFFEMLLYKRNNKNYDEKVSKNTFIVLHIYEN